MAWRLSPGATLQDDFGRVAQGEIARVRADLRSSELDSEKAIHQARRRFKKLRALVRLARPSLGARYAAENHRWRDLGRHLSASRDAAVLLASFDAAVERCGQDLPPRNVKALRTRLCKELPAAHADPADQMADVLPHLDVAASEVSSLAWPKDERALARGLRESQKRLRRRWKAARSSPDTETLHEWRKRVKDMAAQLGLFRAVLTPELKARREDARELAEMLGEEHDLSLLGDWLAGQTGSAGMRATADRLRDDVAARREALRTAAFDKGEALSQRPPAALARELTSLWSDAGKTARIDQDEQQPA